MSFFFGLGRGPHDYSTIWAFYGLRHQYLEDSRKLHLLGFSSLGFLRFTTPISGRFKKTSFTVFLKALIFDILFHRTNKRVKDRESRQREKEKHRGNHIR
jgi:hypothetical protein